MADSDKTVLPNDLKHTKHLLRDVARELKRALPRLNCDYEEVVSSVFKIQANLEGSAAFHIGVDRGKQQQAEKDERLIEELIKYRSYWKQRAVTAEGRLRREPTSQSQGATDDEDEIADILRRADDWDLYDGDEDQQWIFENKVLPDLKTLADAYRAKQADDDDEKMPDVPDSTLTRGQARALTQKPEPGIEILTSAMLRPYESPLFDGPRQATEITFVCPADWDVTRFMRTLREALK